MEPGVTPLNIKDPYPLALPRTKDEKHKIPQLWPKERQDATCQQNRKCRSNRMFTSINHSLATTSKIPHVCRK